jgi:hypothetical protein
MGLAPDMAVWPSAALTVWVDWDIDAASSSAMMRFCARVTSTATCASTISPGSWNMSVLEIVFVAEVTVSARQLSARVFRGLRLRPVEHRALEAPSACYVGHIGRQVQELPHACLQKHLC